ncbi:hypothetical protein M9Y10_020402 [Tritrichomonas musculus]|uniref:Uncharacterized protein n=1 Tax=Tritrichomonas musculus TaxID=1915356 RepID=A0ABR2HG25_9EUKA
MNSIGQEIKVTEELDVIFLMIEYELGEDIDANNNSTNINIVNNSMNNNNRDDNNKLEYSDLLFMYKIY